MTDDSSCSFDLILENEMPELFYTAVFINIILSLIIIIIQLITIFTIHPAIDTYLDDCGRAFNNALNVAEFVRMPIAGVLVLAEVAGISIDEVIYEYEKESFERRALIFGLFGRNDVVNRFVDWPDGKFIQQGYEGEEALLKKANNLRKTKST